VLILVGNTIALKTQKSSCKKIIGIKIESANERSGNMYLSTRTGSKQLQN
jgi:hypothetical protein